MRSGILVSHFLNQLTEILEQHIPHTIVPFFFLKNVSSFSSFSKNVSSFSSFVGYNAFLGQSKRGNYILSLWLRLLAKLSCLEESCWRARLQEPRSWPAETSPGIQQTSFDSCLALHSQLAQWLQSKKISQEINSQLCAQKGSGEHSFCLLPSHHLREIIFP